VLSGRGLCDELITRPEESYRLWCVVCNLENLKNEEAMTRAGSQRHKKSVKSTTDFTERRKFGLIMFSNVDTISYQTVYFRILHH